MAMFSTYIAWTLTTNHGWPYWPAFAFTLVVSFAGGAAIHQGVIRPNENGSVLRVVIVTIGLLLVHQRPRDADLVGRGARGAEPVPDAGRSRSAASRSRSRTSARSASRSATVVVLWLLFQFTKIGLAMRAAAVNPAEARLVGVRVHVDAGARLGPRRRARRDRRHARRAEPCSSTRP